ncbi:MAG: flagellar hook-length control protein FliK [Armatimonadota bacterium]|jgi:flagellar hook-length control protein FliK
MINAIYDPAALPVIGSNTDSTADAKAMPGQAAFADALTLLMGSVAEQQETVDDAVLPVAKEELSDQKASTQEPFLVAMAMPQPLNPQATLAASLELTQNEQGSEAQVVTDAVKSTEQLTSAMLNRPEAILPSVSTDIAASAFDSVVESIDAASVQMPVQTVPKQVQMTTQVAEQLISTLEPALNPAVQPGQQEEPVIDSRIEASDDNLATVQSQAQANSSEPTIGRRIAISRPTGNEPVAQGITSDPRVAIPRSTTAEVEHFKAQDKLISADARPANPVHETAEVQQSDAHVMAMSLQAEARPVTGAQRPMVDSTNSSDLHVRVIQQVVQQIKLQHIDGGSNLLVRLNPPDLGSLQLRVQRNSDGLTTHIEATNHRVQGLLEAHLPLLIDSLAQAGVRMDSVSVSVAAGFSSFADHSRRQDAQPHAQRPRHNDLSSRGTTGMQVASDAAIRSSWASMRQSAHSWLA